VVTGVGLDLEELAVLRSVERPDRDAFSAGPRDVVLRWSATRHAVLASALALGPAS